MTFGVSSEHTSEPRDATWQIDPAATRYLLVVAGGPEVARQIAASMTLPPQVPLELLHLSPRTPSAETIERQVAGKLAASCTGLRLAVSGDEAFVRRVGALAREAGLNDDEVATEIRGSRARRVFCVHCKTTTEDVSTAIAICDGCGRHLQVYHHFSRRLGACMGFQIDAEAPGELPPETRPWD